MISPLAYVDPAAKLGKNVTVQPFAYIEGDVVIGDDCVIMAGAHILNGTRMGRKNTVHHGAVLASVPQDFHYEGEDSDGAHLCHDVQIGNHCVLGIRSMVAGESIVDDCTILSSNVIVQQYCHIGSWVLIQSGCRISKDVPPYVIMAGNPVQYHGINAVVLQHKNQMDDRILRHIMNTYRLIYQGNFSLQDAVLKIEDQIPKSPEIDNIVNFVRKSKGIIR